MQGIFQLTKLPSFYGICGNFEMKLYLGIKPINSMNFMLSVEAMFAQINIAQPMEITHLNATAQNLNVKWLAPPLQCVKINTDGCYS